MSDPERHLRLLSRYRFALVPRGNGIQSPKLWECWLMQVVPVVIEGTDPVMRDIESYGLPVLVLSFLKAVMFQNAAVEETRGNVWIGSWVPASRVTISL